MIFRYSRVHRVFDIKWHQGYDCTQVGFRKQQPNGQGVAARRRPIGMISPHQSRCDNVEEREWRAAQRLFPLAANQLRRVLRRSSHLSRAPARPTDEKCLRTK